ncbi:Methyltransferase domain-containing protein [Oscillospiraceae bacterium]|nr:Methyltransferase domain-containing protein [Oscillospiraceae bacterium]
MSDTLGYYNNNADQFFASTIEADISELRSRFTKHLKQGDCILDLGCGSGRDTKAFLDQGFRVDAIDGSEELCKKASEFTDIQVKHQCFQDLNEEDKYNGVWACASLLHVNYAQLPDVFTKIHKALKTNGIFYMSFKLGDSDVIREDRHFTDMNNERFDALNVRAIGFDEIDRWQTLDVRPDRNVEWFNVILKKV